MGKITTITNHLNNNKGFYVGIEDTSEWVAFYNAQVPHYAEKFYDSTLVLDSNIYTIDTKKAVYKFQKVTNPDENIDTWRLYRGDLKSGNILFNMWNNSDAEGAIKISGETDYVSGFHGSEVMTAFHVFKDGVEITEETSIDVSSFNSLMFYVESDVYHCYQDSGVAETIAFKRAKVVEFVDNKVTISNSYIAQGNFTVTSARIALFQCYKNDGNIPVFTDFSVNSDFKNYTVANVATSVPSASADMTEAILNTIYGIIHFKSILTSGQSYKGQIANFANQNRIKFYFDTISQATSITIGDQIKSQFEFTVI
jgi:hypothetical protein